MELFARWLVVLALTSLALATDAAERTTYFIPDAQGSPVAAMDEQGNVLWRESYAPYGERRTKSAANNARPAYTGKSEDTDTGLVYLGARWYDPESARFTGIDPQGFVESNPQSFGRYVYANNSPYVFVDPTGEVAETGWDIFNIALGVGSFSANASAGNVAGAALDGAGVALDLIATVVPGIPGGAGSAIKAARISESTSGAGKTLVLGENMRDRVIPFAEKTGSAHMPFGTTKEKWAAMSPQERYKLNDGQLRKFLSEGYDVRYIGRDRQRSESQRSGFDLTGSELLRLESRGKPYETVSRDEVQRTIGRD